jgi:hypothetical protein
VTDTDTQAAGALEHVLAVRVAKIHLERAKVDLTRAIDARAEAERHKDNCLNNYQIAHNELQKFAETVPLIDELTNDEYDPGRGI